MAVPLLPEVNLLPDLQKFDIKPEGEEGGQGASPEGGSFQKMSLRRISARVQPGSPHLEADDDNRMTTIFLTEANIVEISQISRR